MLLLNKYNITTFMLLFYAAGNNSEENWNASVMMPSNLVNILISVTQ